MAADGRPPTAEKKHKNAKQELSLDRRPKLFQSPDGRLTTRPRKKEGDQSTYACAAD